MRLKRRAVIRSLFSRNHTGSHPAVSAGSVCLMYQWVHAHQTDSPSPLQVGFAVSRYRTAVERNAMRRILREAFRTSKHRFALPESSGQTLALMLLCPARTPSAQVRTDVDQALQALTARLTSEEPEDAHGS